MTVSPLKVMFLSAALWLPMCFFLWFFLASPLVFPVSSLAGWIMTGLFPDLIAGVTQFGYTIKVQTTLMPMHLAISREGIPVLILQINPMIYGYGLPLLAGLVMATPLKARQRVLQIGTGYLLLIPVQVWGVCWEILKIIGFRLGEQGVDAIHSAGLSLEAVALAYQFGYLILPAVTPLVIWILWNRRFLEALVSGGDLEDPQSDAKDGQEQG